MTCFSVSREKETREKQGVFVYLRFLDLSENQNAQKKASVFVVNSSMGRAFVDSNISFFL